MARSTTAAPGAVAVVDAVEARAAVHEIVAGAADQGVVAVAAIGGVGAAADVEEVVAGVAFEDVVARLAVERVVAVLAAQPVVVGAAVEAVEAGAAGEPVVAGVAVDDVGGDAAADRVVAGVAVDRAGAAADRAGELDGEVLSGGHFMRPWFRADRPLGGFGRADGTAGGHAGFVGVRTVSVHSRVPIAPTRVAAAGRGRALTCERDENSAPSAPAGPGPHQPCARRAVALRERPVSECSAAW